VVSAMDSHGRILGFLDRSHYCFSGSTNRWEILEELRDSRHLKNNSAEMS
jgi:hypothetical protein